MKTVSLKFSFFVAIIIMMVSSSCKEDEKIAVTGISLNETGSVTILVGQELPLVATVEPANATQPGVLWSTSLPGVVYVRDNTVTGLLPGTVEVFATTIDGALTVSVEVTVTNFADGLAFKQKEVSIPRGTTTTLAFDFTPHSATNRAVIWSMEGDADVAEIDPQTGLITGKEYGEVTIRVTSLDDEQLYDYCTLSVVPVPVENVYLNFDKMALLPQRTGKMDFSIYPEEAENKDVTWASSNTALATVDENTGVITAIAPGIVTIEVTTDDGGHTAELTLMIVDEANLGNNLLLNPGFEAQENDIGTALDFSGDITSWEKINANWINNFYPGNTNNPNQNNANIIRRNHTFFDGNGAFFVNHIVNNFVGRLAANGAAGFYQLVDVTPGAVYFISAVVGYNRNNPGQMTIKTDETLKILSPDGFTVYHEEPIITDPSQNSNVIYVKGAFAVPAGIRTVRYQFDQRNNGGSQQNPVMLIDDCRFQEAFVQ